MTTQPDHGGQIIIGLRDLYEQIQRMTAEQSSLAAKVDTALITHTLAQQAISSQLADFRADVNDHELRVRHLEAQRYITAGGMWRAIGIVNALLATVLVIIQLSVKG